MSWLESAVAALIAGVVGAVAAALVAFAAFHWFPFTPLEGAVAWFIGLNALIGFIVAFLIGLMISRALNAWTPVPIANRSPVIGSAAVILIAAITALTLWLLADIPPEIDGQRLNLEVEFRLPSSEVTPPSEIANPAFTLASITSDRTKRKERKGLLKIGEARQEENRWIVPASVLLFTTRGGRLVEAQLGGELIGSFTVPLPGSPGNEHQKWSEWWPRTSVAAPKGSSSATAKAPPPDKTGKTGKTPPAAGKTPPASPAADKGASKGPATPLDVTGYRFRVTRIGRGQLPAEEIAHKQGTTDKPKVDTAAADKARAAVAKELVPIAELLPQTRLGAPDAGRETAIKSIIARPNHVEELAQLMLSDDFQVASDALYLAGKLPAASPELAAGVVSAGRDIAARLDRLNERKLDAAQTTMAATDITARFAAWMEAVRVLRNSVRGVDFTPELVAILERSRVRTDVPTIQRDVRRVASRFAKDWAKIAPAPGDPPW